MMAEVPSNVLILDKFLDVGIDGISIGSNDLTQLLLGVDRDSAMLAQEFDERNEAVMEALHILVRGALRRGVTVSICGQAPSDFPELTRKLVEWGITSISINPDVIDSTRELIAAVDKAGRLAPGRSGDPLTPTPLAIAPGHSSGARAAGPGHLHAGEP
jgi:pyruvate,water dikinase